MASFKTDDCTNRGAGFELARVLLVDDNLTSRLTLKPFSKPVAIEWIPRLRRRKQWANWMSRNMNWS